MTPYIAPNIGICHVNRVIDGDTLECNKLKIRLCGVDSPEKSQPLGTEATNKLTQLTLNQNVRLVISGIDIYNRLLAEVWLNSRLLNAELVQASLAYTYGSCPTQKTVLINAEKSVIANKFGVWKSGAAGQERPWIYRKTHK
jgi:micrococcal nuclease